MKKVFLGMMAITSLFLIGCEKKTEVQEEKNW